MKRVGSPLNFANVDEGLQDAGDVLETRLGDSLFREFREYHLGIDGLVERGERRSRNRWTRRRVSLFNFLHGRRIRA